MDVLTILTVITRLAGLANTLITEKRDATPEELQALDLEQIAVNARLDSPAHSNAVVVTETVDPSIK